MLIHRLIYYKSATERNITPFEDSNTNTQFRVSTAAGGLASNHVVIWWQIDTPPKPIHSTLLSRSNDVETTHDPFPSKNPGNLYISLGKRNIIFKLTGYVNPEGNKYNTLIMAFFLNEIILTVPFLVHLNHSPPGHVIGTNGPLKLQVDERII